MGRPSRARGIGLVLAVMVLVGGGAVEGQALSSNLVFTSLQPCRLFDTRVQNEPLAANTSRTFTVVGGSSDFAGQGGEPGGCGIPGFVQGSPQVIDARGRHPSAAREHKRAIPDCG